MTQLGLPTNLWSFPGAEVHVGPEGVVLEDETDAPVGVVRRVALFHQSSSGLPHRRPLQGRHLRRRACWMQDLIERLHFIGAFLSFHVSDIRATSTGYNNCQISQPCMRFNIRIWLWEHALWYFDNRFTEVRFLASLEFRSISKLQGDTSGCSQTLKSGLLWH